MNTRCHYCGWNFSLSREALEAAVSAALAANEKIHVEHCPRCRRVIKLPVAQLRRGLPVGWAPSAPAAAELAEAGQPPEPVLVPEATPAPDRAADAAEAKPRRRRRTSGAAEAEPALENAAPEPPTKATSSKRASKSKPPTGKTAAETSAAKRTARKQSKP